MQANTAADSGPRKDSLCRGGQEAAQQRFSPQTRTLPFASVRAGVSRRDLCVFHDNSAKECAFSLALQVGEASGLAIHIQAASHHLGGHCLD